LLFSGKWIELDNIILSEVSQIQKYKGHIFFYSNMGDRSNTNTGIIINIYKYIQIIFPKERLLETSNGGGREG
jgi:hypothetical protein